ncbi:hypothetical protein [Deferribacter abyssi]|uniref:hypothetical protein n=1 Tax=Deferribacter abyssi TaxID=213806 RepID=UPI003C243656
MDHIIHMKKKKYEEIHVRLDSEMYEKLKKYSKQEYRTISDTVRMLIDRWIKEKEQSDS